MAPCTSVGTGNRSNSAAKLQRAYVLNTIERLERMVELSLSEKTPEKFMSRKEIFNSEKRPMFLSDRERMSMSRTYMDKA